MIEAHLKKKILNTISKYEEKCSSLQNEVNALRQTIEYLARQNSQQENEIQLKRLRQALKNGVEAATLENHLHVISEIMSGVQKNHQQQQRQVKILISRAMVLFKNADQDKVFITPLNNLEQSLNRSENDTLLMDQFLALLQLSLHLWVKRADDIDQDQQTGEIPPEKRAASSFLNMHVNDGLRALLTSFHFSDAMDAQKNLLLDRLDKPLTEQRFVDILDRIIEMIHTTIRIEQSQLKGVLLQFSQQMEEFNQYLGCSLLHHQQICSDSKELEKGLYEQIEKVQQNLDSDVGVKELIKMVQQGFTMIKDTVRVYREKEQQRIFEYEERIEQLKANLQKTKRQTMEISNRLSYREQHMNEDSLTQLPNRAAYDEHLLQAWHRGQPGFGDLILAIADIDHFKMINDNYGHLAGDKVLKKISLLFKSSIRASDFVARYGGEEFVFIFERTSQKEAMMVLKRIHQQINDTEFHYRNDRVDVTISFGITGVRKSDTLESFFERADQALYEAKKAGRNQIVEL